jgi:hypothetical protein
MTQMTKTPAVTAENTDWMTGFYTWYRHSSNRVFPRTVPRSMWSALLRCPTPMPVSSSQDYGEDYGSDFWHWYTQSDGGFFVCPQTEKTYRVEVHSNYYRGEMSAQALGMTVSLYALCVLAESGHDFFIESYHRLRDFAVRHSEWASIGGAID